jgi:hypothetical protein
MGFIKDLRQLTQVSKQISADWDPAAQMRLATERLDQLSHDRALITTGRRASAVVTNVRETGTFVGNMPMLEFDVVVMPADGVSFVSSGTTVGHVQLGLVRQGERVDVRYDPSNTSRVSLDLHPVAGMTPAPAAGE